MLNFLKCLTVKIFNKFILFKDATLGSLGSPSHSTGPRKIMSPIIRVLDTPLDPLLPINFVKHFLYFNNVSRDIILGQVRLGGPALWQGQPQNTNHYNLHKIFNRFQDNYFTFKENKNIYLFDTLLHLTFCNLDVLLFYILFDSTFCTPNVLFFDVLYPLSGMLRKKFYKRWLPI